MYLHQIATAYIDPMDHLFVEEDIYPVFPYISSEWWSERMFQSIDLLDWEILAAAHGCLDSGLI